MKVENAIKIKMQYKRLLLSVILLLGFGLIGLYAQENINATGGNALGGGGTASYSVGQVTYQTHIGTNGSVAEGVQQPYEISVETGIEESKGINLSFSAYPNPTDNNVTLIISEDVISGLSYQLYDNQGKLLQNEKITNNQTSIVLSNLAPATYFIKIKQRNKEIITYKIIKN